MKRRTIIIALAFTPFACAEPFSNEDLMYVKALPTTRDVHVEVPQPIAPMPGSGAEAYEAARMKGEQLNQITTDVLALVESVSSYPPTSRDDANNSRTWGPFPGSEGVQLIMYVKRVETATIAKTTSTSTPTAVSSYFDFSLGARKSELMDWQTYFAGRSFGEMGAIFVNFEAIHALEGKPQPRGLVYNTYDNSNNQHTIEMGFDFAINPNKPFEQVEGGYRYEAAESGLITFIFTGQENIPELQPDTGPETYAWATRFLPDHRGRAEQALLAGDLGSVKYYATECWDEDFMRTFLAGNIPGLAPFGTFDGCAPELRSQLGER